MLKEKMANFTPPILPPKSQYYPPFPDLGGKIENCVFTPHRFGGNFQALTLVNAAVMDPPIRPPVFL